MNAWDFSLELITRLTPIALALIVCLQMKARTDRVEIREKITEIAHSVNGMKSELVAATAKGSYLEGAKDQSEKVPEAVLAKAEDVAKEVLAEAERKAKS